MEKGSFYWKMIYVCVWWKHCCGIMLDWFGDNGLCLNNASSSLNFTIQTNFSIAMFVCEGTV